MTNIDLYAGTHNANGAGIWLYLARTLYLPIARR
jgi:hypothetical protein